MVSPLVVIVGETASGKSALGLEIAKTFNSELICADSWTVYKGFDIGTAKPNTTERARVPHHLLDIAEPTQGFSVATFKELAQDAITDIVSRGKLPIMVGGTGLYVDSILYDYSFLAEPAPGIRDELNRLTLPELLLKAAVMGLDTALVDVRNKRRVIRLIENNGLQPTKQPLRANTLSIGVSVPRTDLQERITDRVNMMLTSGLENEVLSLSRRLGWECEPMKGIGYSEWKLYFSGMQTLEQTRQNIIAGTMALAKKQRTWFRRNSSIQWLTDRSNAVEIVTTFLNK